MTKIYSGFGSKILLTLSAFIIYVSNGYAQTCTTTAVASSANCAGTTETENFDQNSGGFSGTNLTYTLPSNNDGSFEAGTSIPSSGTATLVSPTYSYVNSAIFSLEVEAGAGNFDYTVQLLDQNGTPIGSSCNSTTVNNTGDFICASFSNIPLNTNFRIRFTFTNKENNARALRVDNYAIGSPSGIVLPTKLTQFDVKPTSTGNILNWTIANDATPSTFNIERSDNGNQYYNIGSVTGAGQKNYTFTDRKPTQGTVYYRIKAVDVDGTYKYSAVVNVKNGRSTIAFNAFPIPTKGRLWLQHNKLSANASISVTAADGRVLQKVVVIPGAIETNIDLTPYNNGLYLIHLNNGSSIETIKITKQ